MKNAAAVQSPSRVERVHLHDRLHRGPDRYARPDLRLKARRVRRLSPDDVELATVLEAPELVGEYAFWRDTALEVADGLADALDRLDDVETLLEAEGARIARLEEELQNREELLARAAELDETETQLRLDTRARDVDRAKDAG